MRYRRNTEETNFWAGYADCMLALFMIALLLWITGSGLTIFGQEEEGLNVKSWEEQIIDLKSKIEELRTQLEGKDKTISKLNNDIARLKELIGPDIAKLEAELHRVKQENAALRIEVKELTAKNDELAVRNRALVERNVDLTMKNAELEEENAKLKERLGPGVNDKPPVINLTAGAAKEFSFPSGEADIPSEFSKRLRRETFGEVAKILDDYKGIDTLEIVGHTDGSPINTKGNLDLQIPKLLNGRIKKGALVPGSNTDLGLMRALAIRNEWNDWKRDKRYSLSEIDVRCYSAAQTVPVGKKKVNEADWLAPDPEARRIEIRFLQLQQ